MKDAPDTKPSGIEPLLTAADFRRILKVSDRTFRRWLSGALVPKPDVTIGSAKRWRKATVEKFIGGKGGYPSLPLRGSGQGSG